MPGIRQGLCECHIFTEKELRFGGAQRVPKLSQQVPYSARTCTWEAWPQFQESLHSPSEGADVPAQGKQQGWSGVWVGENLDYGAWNWTIEVPAWTPPMPRGCQDSLLLSNTLLRCVDYNMYLSARSSKILAGFLSKVFLLSLTPSDR